MPCWSGGTICSGTSAVLTLQKGLVDKRRRIPIRRTEEAPDSRRFALAELHFP